MDKELTMLVIIFSDYFADSEVVKGWEKLPEETART
jgi:hypothetical protein